jgi:hypothetical protein
MLPRVKGAAVFIEHAACGKLTHPASPASGLALLMRLPLYSKLNQEAGSA